LKCRLSLRTLRRTYVISNYPSRERLYIHIAEESRHIIAPFFCKSLFSDNNMLKRDQLRYPKDNVVLICHQLSWKNCLICWLTFFNISRRVYDEIEGKHPTPLSRLQVDYNMLVIRKHTGGIKIQCFLQRVGTYIPLLGYDTAIRIVMFYFPSTGTHFVFSLCILQRSTIHNSQYPFCTTRLLQSTYYQNITDHVSQPLRLHAHPRRGLAIKRVSPFHDPARMHHLFLLRLFQLQR
jgi:hypothetical protein